MSDFSFPLFSANYFIKPCQKHDVSLHDQNKWKRDSFSVLQKVQMSFSVMPIFFRKSFVAQLLWSSLNWKIINLVINLVLEMVEFLETVVTKACRILKTNEDRRTR